jgi:hypothetical protein
VNMLALRDSVGMTLNAGAVFGIPQVGEEAGTFAR